METYGWNVRRESTEGMNTTRVSEGRECMNVCMKEMYANTTLALYKATLHTVMSRIKAGLICVSGSYRTVS